MLSTHQNAEIDPKLETLMTRGLSADLEPVVNCENSMQLEDILLAAIDDEYQARATYRAIIDAFGPVKPFINIVQSEDRHVHALLDLYDRFGIEPPPDDWSSKISAPESVADACRNAVAAEKENAKLYERLLAETKEPVVRRVLENLQRASQENHLPAFQRCLEREETGRGSGEGCGDFGGRQHRHRHRGGRGG